MGAAKASKMGDRVSANETTQIAFTEEREGGGGGGHNKVIG
jgi:hypothetical protein